MYKFVWKIENFSYLKGEPFLSPYMTDFDLGEFKKCQLSITQGHYEILAHVPKLKNESPHCYLYCSISFLDFDRTPLICKVSEIKYAEGLVPTKMDILIFPNDTKYFPNNTLRVECCMWSGATRDPLSHIFSLYAFTEVESNTKVVRKTFQHQISGFSAIASNSPFVINKAIWNEQGFEIKILFPQYGQADVCLSTTSWFGFHAKIGIFVLDTSGKMMEFGRYDAPFTSAKRSLAFKLNASKLMFLQYENIFLPLDTLSLVIYCTFSGRFAIDRRIEISDIFSNSTTNNASTVAEVSKTEADSDESETRQENETTPPNTIVQTLKDILMKGYMSDFNLKVGDKVFPVHKNILGARSKFFGAMFDSEMKETQDNCVDIKDVDADTLQRMLHFIYSDRIDEDLDWADATSLYAAADFYALESLKQGCSTILKDGLSTTSALGVLHLADLHQDQQLKSAALDFISLNDKDIIGTKDWMKFQKDNVNLALETLGELYSRKMKG